MHSDYWRYGAIGGALAYEYAMLDVVLLLQGRNEKRLEELAKYVEIKVQRL